MFVFKIELQSLKASEHSLLQMQYLAAMFTGLDNHKILTTETKICFFKVHLHVRFKQSEFVALCVFRFQIFAVNYIKQAC
jgi:hypothetical protein